MVEAAQVRAARALIGWSQAKLAETTGLSVSAINAFETVAPNRIANEAAVDKMRAALEAAGVIFLPKEEGGGGIGVRLHEAHEGEYIGWNDLNASNDE
jgi:transcriptional regulator with XRE-family HTH domain